MVVRSIVANSEVLAAVGHKAARRGRAQIYFFRSGGTVFLVSVPESFGEPEACQFWSWAHQSDPRWHHSVTFLSVLKSEC